MPLQTQVVTSKPSREDVFSVVSYSITLSEVVDYRIDISACSMTSLQAQLKERLERLKFDHIDTDNGYTIKKVRINKIESIPTLIKSHINKQHGTRNGAGSGAEWSIK